MSVNLKLAFVIRGYTEEQRDPLYHALKNFVKAEGFTTEGGNSEFTVDILLSGPKENICAYTSGAVIISGAGRWLPDVEQRFKAMVLATGGEHCRTEFEVEDVDN